MQITDIINKVIEVPGSAFFYTPLIYGKSNSYLFLKPEKKILVRSLRNLDENFKEIDKHIQKGFIGYSLLNYEAGYLFEKSLNKYSPKEENLIQFFFYDKKDVQIINSSLIEFENKEKYKVKNFKLNTSKRDFAKSIKKIKYFIKEGDTYQVNYTVKAKFDFEGSIAALFSNLVFNQSAKYIAVINNNSNIIISFSPELFFEIEKRKIISKPMKGTAKRGIEPTSDSLKRYELRNSIKNRSENIMIVDMIRNDLGKVSKYNSVQVNDMFEIEKYESVFQMVSTIEAELKKEIKLTDVIKNIFPCASITGAPKIQTMKIIKELEKENRGIYTGAIGLITKDKFTFNVPIRTLLMNKNNGKGEIGLGSGVVWDSSSEEEYYETLLKGKFLYKPQKQFELLETMLVKNGKILFLKAHLDRMNQAAEYFLFNFDREMVQNELNKIVKNITSDHVRLRVTLNKFGKLSYSVLDLSQPFSEINIIISDKKINSKNTFQYFKTTNRNLYDSQFKKYSGKGFFDVIFFNERNELAEGSITNIFIEKNGIISTPNINSGILSGVYRKHLLSKDSSIIKRKLYYSDLIQADKIFLTNSVRGQVIVDKLFLNDKEFINYNLKQ